MFKLDRSEFWWKLLTCTHLSDNFLRLCIVVALSFPELTLIDILVPVSSFLAIIKSYYNPKISCYIYNHMKNFSIRNFLLNNCSLVRIFITLTVLHIWVVGSLFLYASKMFSIILGSIHLLTRACFFALIVQTNSAWKDPLIQKKIRVIFYRYEV